MEGEIDNSSIIVGLCNIPLSIMDKTTRQKINKETELEQYYKMQNFHEREELLSAYRRKANF